MTRDLTEVEIEYLLRTQYYGHLGCCHEGKSYVVPVTYAYKEKAIYIFSFEGQKIGILRSEPRACFQIEELTSSTSWKSVILWGKFEELKRKEERENALTLLLGRLWEEGAKGKSLYMPFRSSPEKMERAMNDKGVVLYRIKIEEKTRRAEEYE